MMIFAAFVAGLFGGVLGFWSMFALAEWLFAPLEPKPEPRGGYYDPLA